MSIIEHIKKKKERNEFILFILKINNKNIIVYIYIYITRRQLKISEILNYIFFEHFLSY